MLQLLFIVAAFITFAPIVIALMARSKVNALAQRLSRVEDAIDRLAFDLGRPSPAPKAPPVEPTKSQAEAAKPAAAQPQETASEPQGAAPGGPASPFEPPPAPPSPPPPSGESFEQRLGTRWAVWAGGAALALGGLLLVRYSIEAGLFGPAFRVTAGAFLAAALIAAGEWMRRGELDIPIEYLPKAHIPSVLTAAGTLTAFATIYAAHALYGFIGPTAAFLLLGATGVIAMLAAALHGPWLAGLGLVGSFATPLLVSSNSPNPWPVVLYLAVVATTAYVLARTRRWKWLAIATVAGAAFWGWLLVSAGDGAATDTPLAAAAFVFAQLCLAAFFLGVEPHAGRRDGDAAFDRFAALCLGALTLVALLVVIAPQLDFNSRQVFAALAIAVLTATAWRTASVAVAAALGAILSAGALIAWPDLDLPPDVTLTAPWAEGVLRLPANTSGFLSFAALSTLVPSAVMTLRLWRGPLLPPLTAALYAGAATVPPLLALILSYLRVTQFDVSIPFALGGAALTIAFAYLAEHFHRADQSYSSPAYHMASGIFAAAAMAALALALTMALSRGYLTVAFALAALGASYVAANRDLVPLRAAVSALGLIVLARVALDPRIMGDGVGATPIFNWLLIGYGVPAAAFYLSARCLATRREDFAVRLSDSLAVIFFGLLLFFEVRHLTNGGDVMRADAGHVESGLYVFIALAMSFALARMNLARANPVFDAASLIFGVGSVVMAAVGLLVFANPLFTGDAIQGATLFSSLLPAYLLPGVAALFVARHTRAFRPDWYVRAAGILGVVLITAYATLEVRHAFQGPLISIWHGASDAEHWAYSAAWLLLGVAFLGYGLLRGSVEARAASAALIVLAALKVTFFDLAGIGGFWRALSFISLGAVLIGIGLVYQKLIFANPSRDTPETVG
ncbi:MAG: DUF2339 domain-containing protein [Hyphomicrobium sp.]